MDDKQYYQFTTLESTGKVCAVTLKANLLIAAITLKRTGSKFCCFSVLPTHVIFVQYADDLSVCVCVCVCVCVLLKCYWTAGPRPGSYTASR